MLGLVKWFNDAKGYGFIHSTSTDEDIFVHFSAISASGFRTLTEDDEVEFETEDTPKGKKAVNVSVLSQAVGQ